MPTLERSYDASPSELWQLWTTPAGIEQWWSPDGFAVVVDTLDLRPGGELVYTMTAVGPEQVQFMEAAGMPLQSVARKTFTEVEPERRLGYLSLVDFVPGVEPYEHLTVVELEAKDGGTHVVMTFEPMHDDDWTQRLYAGRENELDNLAGLLRRR